MNKLVKDIPAKRLSYEFLHSLNGIIGLTERELQLLAAMLDLYLAEPKYRDSIDCTDARKKIISITGVSKENLSRYIRLFKQKGLLARSKKHGASTLNTAIVPVVIGGKTVQITMILKIKSNEQLQGE